MFRHFKWNICKKKNIYNNNKKKLAKSKSATFSEECVQRSELMMMSDTCTTHRSRVPRRSSGRIKGGVTTVQDERGPGLDCSLCFVCGSRP